MQSVLSATRTILLQFQTPGIIAAIFLRGIVPLFAINAREGNHRANIFLFRCHMLLQPPGCSFRLFLLEDLGDDARADRQTAFADRELRALLQRHRYNQFHFQVHVVARHHHLYPFR